MMKQKTLLVVLMGLTAAAANAAVPEAVSTMFTSVTADLIIIIGLGAVAMAATQGGKKVVMFAKGLIARL
jgi:hypothetical protein